MDFTSKVDQRRLKENHLSHWDCRANLTLESSEDRLKGEPNVISTATCFSYYLFRETLVLKY
jgi:hypothetical protein